MAVNCVRNVLRMPTKYILLIIICIDISCVVTSIMHLKEGVYNNVKESVEKSIEDKQRTRNFNIRRICGPNKSVKNLTSTQARYVYDHMIVDDINGLLYCYIPKVGCSNWKHVIAVLTGEYITTLIMLHYMI